MNNRERLLAILDHQPPDRIPWIPRLELWYRARERTGTMPERFKGLSLRQVERALGLGTPARDGHIFKIERDGVDVVVRRAEGKQITEYHTPVGKVRSVMHYSEDLEAQGLPGRIEEWPCKGPADYHVWEWIMQHTRYVPTYDEYLAYDREIGEDGLPMVNTGDVPLHDFCLNLAGYEHAFFQLADYPDEVEHLLGVITEVHRERLWPVILNSPARLTLHGVHLSSQFAPPRLFKKYILPYCQEFFPLLHQHGKSVAMHADNDTSMILELLEQAGWDMLECFVTAPMVPLTLEQARAKLGNRVILWGGLPSLLLSPSISEEDFRQYMHNLLKTIAPGDAFILGVADNVMPDSLIERVAWVTELLEQKGHYPLS